MLKTIFALGAGAIGLGGAFTLLIIAPKMDSIPLGLGMTLAAVPLGFASYFVIYALAGHILNSGWTKAYANARDQYI